MRLREIKLAGFKSFVDPTTVTFPGNRCAVVGPNGCGKSNIIDAVRWVLGESSARQLRGEALTDVIFNGSVSRQPTSLASIELIFDNGDGRAGGEFANGKFASYSEIAVRREVTRDGQSTYYLNGARCRRRDVADVFMGTGIGPRSYSIIEQGMVSQLVEAKPEELRTHLEEAAGISKYRERRRETQNRIKHTVDNLERLGDRTDELGRHLAHLKRQARAAERYRELKERSRRLSAELHALRLGVLESRLASKESRIETLEAEHAGALAARARLDAALERDRDAHLRLTGKRADVQGRWHGLGAEMARLEQGIEYNNERLQQFREDLAELTTRHRDTKDQLDADSRRIEELNAKLASKAPRLADSEADGRAAGARLADIDERVKEGERAWEDCARRIGDNSREVEVKQSRIEHGEQVLKSLRARAGALETEPSSVVDAGVERLSRQIEESARRVEALRAGIAANAEKVASVREERSLRERAREEANAELQRLGGELARLEAVQRAAVGKAADASSEAARWLRDHGLADVPRLAEALHVASGWEAAVEAALGDLLDAVAVEDTGGLANDLANLRRGRVSLYEARPSPPSDGALQPLSALVDSPVGSLLDGVFAADTMAIALEYRSALAPGQRIVTRGGVLIGADWIRGGTPGDQDQDQGVLARARAIGQIKTEREEAEARFVECDARLAQTREQLLALEGERETLQTRYAAAAEELSRVTREHDVRQVRMEEADARARRNAADREEVHAQIANESKLLEEYRARLAELIQSAATLRSEAEALREVRDREAGELSQARQDAQAARDAVHALRGEYQGMRTSLTASEMARQRLLDQRRDFDRRMTELGRVIADVESTVPDQRDTLAQKAREREELEAELAELQRKIDRTEAELNAATAKRIDADAAVESVRGRLEEARVERERLVTNRDNERGQLADTGFDRAQVQRELPDDATEPVWVESLERIEARTARLGPINLAAIEEYEERSEEKRNLDAQCEDLEAALATLRNAIRRIDRDTRVRFKDTFERVDEHLQDLFPRFFGGGSARLVRIGDDWLDAGVALMARPPGKRNPTVHQLSGGEKAMAAVALIFSIFQLNPSPVCLLDEVDAPLDDTNVGRFGDLIGELSKDVQFVVITHNKQTIEMADHLLGVTMQEPGVSRLVSVDMEGAARMAAG